MAKKSHNQIIKKAIERGSAELPRMLAERDQAYIGNIHSLSQDAIRAIERGNYLYAAKSLKAASGELGKMADALLYLHAGGDAAPG
jgi:hypothetical protein